jgi:deglycase
MAQSAVLMSERPAATDRIAVLDGYDAMRPDTLQIIPEAAQFVRLFFDEGKPVAAICQGPWTLIDADAGPGRTSWPSLRSDLRNAGATWVDSEVVVDGKLVTSRKRDDLPAFNREVLGMFAKAESVRAV